MVQNILEYFSIPEDSRAHWLQKIAGSDWRAAARLHELLEQDLLRRQYGLTTQLFLFTQDQDLLAFCTLSERDEIDDDTLGPWIGFVYTFPEHRGSRYSQILIDYACSHARTQGHQRVCLSSGETGLYEKYGFRFSENRETIWNEITGLFIREL